MLYAIGLACAFMTVVRSDLYKGGSVDWRTRLDIRILNAPIFVVRIRGLIVMAIYWIAAIRWIVLDLIGGAIQATQRR